MSRSLYARLARRHAEPATLPTRRQMLEATLAASAGLLLSGTGCATAPRRPAAPAPPATGRPNGRRVTVVGAGFAGLACAYELTTAGYAVTVLEARPRVGGRVLTFTDFVPGRVVEGGGELIGSNHPVWIAYAARFGLEFLDVSDLDLDAPIVLDGRRLDAAASEALFVELDAALASITRDARPVDAGRPWASPGAAALDRLPTSEKLAGLGLSPTALRALRVQFAADNGVEPERQSYLGNLAAIKGGGLEAYWTESEVYRCRGGNQQLAQRLAAALPQGAIRLGAPVARIERRGDGIVVSTADGGSFTSDHAVLAVPPSVWPRIVFDPALPADLAPQMGVNVKYLAHLRSRFWREANLSPDALTDGPVSMTWEGTDNQAGDGRAAMVAFSGGDAAARCRAVPPAGRDAFYAAEIEPLYPGFGGQFAGARFMDWPGDEWCRAGYSFPAPGEVTRLGPLLEAGQPPLHFAGEHCAYRFVGYMEGALSSGAAVAARIARTDGVAAAPAPEALAPPPPMSDLLQRGRRMLS